AGLEPLNFAFVVLRRRVFTDLGRMVPCCLTLPSTSAGGPIPYHTIQRRCASQQNRAPDFRFGSKADIGESATDVRFTPESGHRLSALGRPLSAVSGCEQVHQIAPIQSTSSLHQVSEDYDCER